MRTRDTVEYAMSDQKILKLIRHVFTTTITLKLFDGRGEMIFHKRLKLDKKPETHLIYYGWDTTR
jgi:hypothetical protein